MSDRRADARVGYPELLEASRRIDWRFLLPSPDLGHVACGAGADPALVRACELLAASCTTLGGGAARSVPEPGSLDVVVLADPDGEALRGAVDLLRPEGWAYVEVHGPLDRRGRRRAGPRFPRDYAAELRRLGLADVATHWHWPDFDATTEILPLDEPRVIDLALARKQAAGRRTRGLTAGRLLLRARLLPLVVTHASVIGRRTADVR